MNRGTWKCWKAGNAAAASEPHQKIERHRARCEGNIQMPKLNCIFMRVLREALADTEMPIAGIKKGTGTAGINYVTFHVFHFFIFAWVFLFLFVFWRTVAASCDSRVATIAKMSANIQHFCCLPPLRVSIFIFVHVCAHFGTLTRGGPVLVTNFDWHIEFSLDSIQDHGGASHVRSINWGFLETSMEPSPSVICESKSSPKTKPK